MESSVIDFTVNGASYAIPREQADAVPYSYIVTLAKMRQGDGVYTITYDPAHDFGGNAGTLQPGRTVKITPGMHFDCVKTGQA